MADDDEIALYPVTAYEMASLPEKHVMMRLDYQSDPDDPTSTLSAPLILTADSAIELAEALREAAEDAAERTDTFDNSN